MSEINNAGNSRPAESFDQTKTQKVTNQNKAAATRASAFELVDIDEISASRPVEQAFEPATNFNRVAEEEEKDPLVQAAETLESFLPEEARQPNTKLQIDRDEESGRFIYKSVDIESGEIIRQFPPEDILEFLSIFRNVQGLAVDDTA